MIRLIEPNEKYLKSYIEAYDEYNNNHVITYAFDDARYRWAKYNNEKILESFIGINSSL